MNEMNCAQLCTGCLTLRVMYKYIDTIMIRKHDVFCQSVDFLIFMHPVHRVLYASFDLALAVYLEEIMEFGDLAKGITLTLSR